MNARVVNAIYPIMVKQRHIKVRSGKHIGISKLTFKKTKPSRESLIRGHIYNMIITLLMMSVPF